MGDTLLLLAMLAANLATLAVTAGIAHRLGLL